MTDKIIQESKKRITQNFSQNHKGIDFGARKEEQENRVFAHSKGIVKKTVTKASRYPYNDGSIKTYGNYVDIDHGNGLITRYAHLKEGNVKVGESVQSTTQIGIMGTTGYVTGRHLHFEVLKNNRRINPYPYLTQDFENTKKEIYYQSHDSKYQWNPNVSIGSKEYAGNFGYPIDAVYMDSYRIRVHDMVKNEWLPWVENRNDYAGNYNNAMDGIQIDHGKKKKLKYRAHTKGGTWLSWVSGYNNTPNGYAGIYGRPIDAIEVKFF